MSNISLIIDPSESFLLESIDKQKLAWGHEKSSTKQLTAWTFGGTHLAVSLFNTPSITHLNLQNKKDLKAFVALLDKEKKNKTNRFKDKWFGTGLIITTTTAQGASKVEKLVKESGGSVRKKENAETTKKQLLDPLNIHKSLKESLMLYAGEEYEMLVPFVRRVEKMTPEEQAKLTSSEALTMIPTKPGAIPPWEFTDAMLSGNIAKAMKSTERLLITANPLVGMVFLRRRIECLYRLKVLNTYSKPNDKELAEIGIKGPDLWNTKKMLGKVSLNTCKHLRKLTSDAEVELKGGGTLSAEQIFLTLVSRITLSIATNQSI